MKFVIDSSTNPSFFDKKYGSKKRMVLSKNGSFEVVEKSLIPMHEITPKTLVRFGDTIKAITTYKRFNDDDADGEVILFLRAESMGMACFFNEESNVFPQIKT